VAVRLSGRSDADATSPNLRAACQSASPPNAASMTPVRRRVMARASRSSMRRARLIVERTCDVEFLSDDLATMSDSTGATNNLDAARLG
jgi:hypothetical protein